METLQPIKDIQKLPEQGADLNSFHQNLASIDVPLSNSEHLNNNETSFSFHQAVEHAGAENESLGVDQGLIGVVSLGPNAAVGIIRVDVNGDKFLAISKMKKGTSESGDRAELLGIVRHGESLTLGRNDIDVDDSEISRNHFKIVLNDEVNIEDTSLNGMDVVTFETDKEAQDNIPIKGLRRFLNKSKKKDENNIESSVVDVSEFISTIEGWSIPSSQLFEIANPVKKSENEADWGYTLTPDKMILLGKEIKGYEEPYVDETGAKVPAKFLGREVIKRDSKINGGVYIVPGIQEAIVVDDGQGRQDKGNEKWKPVNQRYEDAYRDFKFKLSDKRTTSTTGQDNYAERDVVTAALESAMDILKYDLSYSEEIADNLSDKKINLDVFISEGKGVCRHQALLAGYYIERLIEGGKLKGSISVDRNQIKGKGGHAWARYTNENGQVYIIDPAQKFSGTLQEARKTAFWNYDRPDEK